MHSMFNCRLCTSFPNKAVFRVSYKSHNLYDSPRNSIFHLDMPIISSQTAGDKDIGDILQYSSLAIFSVYIYICGIYSNLHQMVSFVQYKQSSQTVGNYNKDCKSV